MKKIIIAISALCMPFLLCAQSLSITNSGDRLINDFAVCEEIMEINVVSSGVRLDSLWLQVLLTDTNNFFGNYSMMTNTSVVVIKYGSPIVDTYALAVPTDMVHFAPGIMNSPVQIHINGCLARGIDTPIATKIQYRAIAYGADTSGNVVSSGVSYSSTTFLDEVFIPKPIGEPDTVITSIPASGVLIGTFTLEPAPGIPYVEVTQIGFYPNGQFAGQLPQFINPTFIDAGGKQIINTGTYTYTFFGVDTVIQQGEKYRFCLVSDVPAIQLEDYIQAAVWVPCIKAPEIYPTAQPLYNICKMMSPLGRKVIYSDNTEARNISLTEESVYPNPATGKLSISCSNCNAILTDISGHCIARKQILHSGYLEKPNNAPTGLYFLNLAPSQKVYRIIFN